MNRTKKYLFDTQPLFSCCFLICVAALLFAHPARAQLAAPNEEGVRFAHVHLYVSDTGPHKKLWTELFDGVLVEKDRFAAVRVPGALIFLTKQEPTAPSRSTAMDHFGFRVRDLEAILTEWRMLGYKTDRKFESFEGFPKAYITMPGGVRLELEEDPGLPLKAKMDHVHFFTPQYRELPTWYADLFGATPQFGTDTLEKADVPGVGLRFSKSKEERMPTEGTVIDHIGFEVEDMDAFVEMLQGKGKGVELEFGPHYVESLDLCVAFFTDPSGVLVEVTEGLDKY